MCPLNDTYISELYVLLDPIKLGHVTTRNLAISNQNFSDNPKFVPNKSISAMTTHCRC